jgi:hypothetical protein
MNADRYFDGDAFPEDFFPGADGGEGQEGSGVQDDIERTFELEERELNQRMLFRTVRTLERSVANWRHLSSRAQRKMIKDQFNFFLDLLEGDELEDDLDPEEKD